MYPAEQLPGLIRLILEVPIRVALANPVRALANDICLDESTAQPGFQVRECFAGCPPRAFLANRSRTAAVRVSGGVSGWRLASIAGGELPYASDRLRPGRRADMPEVAPARLCSPAQIPPMVGLSCESASRK